MPSENPLIAESRRRLEHLRAMPETPMRRREMLSLERLLQELPLQTRKTTAGSGGARKKAMAEDEDDEPDVVKKKVRKIRRADGTLEVIKTEQPAEAQASPQDIAAEEKNKKKQMADMRSLMGFTYRGMS